MIGLDKMKLNWIRQPSYISLTLHQIPPSALRLMPHTLGPFSLHPHLKAELAAAAGANLSDCPANMSVGLG